MNNISVKSKVLVFSCLVLLSLPLAGQCADTTIMLSKMQVTMQIEQYNRLQAIINQQEMTLTMLEDKLNQLSKNSMTQQETLTALQNELKICKNQLEQTKTLLQTANTSLAKAEETLKKQEVYLQTLKRQIDSLSHKVTVAKRQRDIWAMGAGLLLIGSIAQ